LLASKEQADAHGSRTRVGAKQLESVLLLVEVDVFAAHREAKSLSCRVLAAP